MSFLFGGSKSTSEAPEWLRGPAEHMLNRSIQQDQVGYMPWRGPDIAAFDPAQVAAMQNTNAAANAFGMQSAMPRIPDAQDFGGGTWGYSGQGLYEDAMRRATEAAPGQMRYYNSFFVDPITGMPRENTSPVSALAAAGIKPEQPDYGGGGDHGYGGPSGGSASIDFNGGIGFGGFGGVSGNTDAPGGFFGGLFG